ncbi:hypothetical protein SAMN04489724_1906 [Algoriphagus locisalis]|uniref:Addiction module component n=1 Tax=Algoriphagus locisalis TaxID=305507 RepID=A0A1I7AEL9_9BACT|nr:hypothetical protein [Algoriphagus locisalis]SFT73392.1 hypothetical protein SAMN04489724_1906 [Algoriphagus locisalis]
MVLETLKLELIERVMRMKDTSVLERLEELIEQAELESRTKESLQSIKRGETVSLKDFGNQNRRWLKEKAMK